MMLLKQLKTNQLYKPNLVRNPMPRIPKKLVQRPLNPAITIPDLPPEPEPQLEEAPPIKPKKGIMEIRKTKCPLTRTEFARHADTMPITINSEPRLLSVKQFQSGSFGWYLNDKTYVIINGKEVKVQIGITMTVVGSKQADI